MAKFAVQGQAAERIYSCLPDRKTLGTGTKMGVSLLSGTIAGVAAAIISHPADTLLSKINKKGAGGEGGMFTRMGQGVCDKDGCDINPFRMGNQSFYGRGPEFI